MYILCIVNKQFISLKVLKLVRQRRANFTASEFTILSLPKMQIEGKAAQ